MDIQYRIERLKSLILRSKEERGIFSRNGYGFAIVSPDKYDVIPKEELTILEQEYCLSLPDEYKAFVTEIANGGVHPMCGLFAVQPHEKGRLGKECWKGHRFPFFGLRWL